MDDLTQTLFIQNLLLSLLFVMITANLILSLLRRRPDRIAIVGTVALELISKEKDCKETETQTEDVEIGAEPDPCAPFISYNYGGEVSGKNDDHSLNDTGGPDGESTDLRDRSNHKPRHRADRPSTEDEEGRGLDEHVAFGKEGRSEAIKRDDIGEGASTLEKDDMSYDASYLDGTNAETSCGILHDRVDDSTRTANENWVGIENSFGNNESDKIPNELLEYDDYEEQTGPSNKDSLYFEEEKDRHASDLWSASVTNKDQTPSPVTHTDNQRSDVTVIKYTHPIGDEYTNVDNNPKAADDTSCETPDHQTDVIKSKSSSPCDEAQIWPLSTCDMTGNVASGHSYLDGTNAETSCGILHERVDDSTRTANENWVGIENSFGNNESDKISNELEYDDYEEQTGPSNKDSVYFEEEKDMHASDPWSASVTNKDQTPSPVTHTDNQRADVTEINYTRPIGDEYTNVDNNPKAADDTSCETPDHQTDVIKSKSSSPCDEAQIWRLSTCDMTGNVASGHSYLDGTNAETSCGILHDRVDDSTRTANENWVGIENSFGNNESDKISNELEYDDYEEQTGPSNKDSVYFEEEKDRHASDPWSASVTNKGRSRGLDPPFTLSIQADKENEELVLSTHFNNQTPSPVTHTDNQRADVTEINYTRPIGDEYTNVDNNPKATDDNTSCETPDHQNGVIEFKSSSPCHEAQLRRLSTCHMTGNVASGHSAMKIDGDKGDGNHSLVLPNVHSKAQKNFQIGDYNNLTEDNDTGLTTKTDLSSLESGYGSMESEKGSLTDHENDFEHPEKRIEQCSVKDTFAWPKHALMAVVSLDPSKRMYTIVKILRLNPGSKEEQLFVQIGLGNEIKNMFEGEYIICTFECFLEPIKRFIRFRILPSCIFLIRIDPSKRLMSMIERSQITPTFGCSHSSERNINEQGPITIEGMMMPLMHCDNTYMPYTDKADSLNQTLIVCPLCKSSGQNINTGDSVYSNLSCSDRIFQMYDTGSNSGVKQIAKIDDPLFCTGETHFDASRCPSQTHPTQWSDKEEFITLSELEVRNISKGSNICTESIVHKAPRAADVAQCLKGKTLPIIASRRQQIAYHGEERYIAESRFDEKEPSDDIDKETDQKESDDTNEKTGLTSTGQQKYAELDSRLLPQGKRQTNYRPPSGYSKVNLLKSPRLRRRSKTKGKKMVDNYHLLRLRIQRKHWKIRKNLMRKYKVDKRCFRRSTFDRTHCLKSKEHIVKDSIKSMDWDGFTRHSNKKKQLGDAVDIAPMLARRIKSYRGCYSENDGDGLQKRIELTPQTYRNHHSICIDIERKEKVRKTVRKEASTLVHGAGHRTNCTKDESSDQSIKGPPIKYGEDVWENHLQDCFDRRTETYGISNQEQPEPELYVKDINTMGSLDRHKVTEDQILKQNYDKELSLKHIPSANDPSDCLQKYFRMQISRQLEKVPPQELGRLLGYFQIDYIALNEDGLLCQTSHIEEIIDAFQKSERFIREFIVEKMQSVEICPGVFIKHPNDIDIELCK